VFCSSNVACRQMSFLPILYHFEHPVHMALLFRLFLFLKERHLRRRLVVNTLQTHCHTLQHTAAHCSTLQHLKGRHFRRRFVVSVSRVLLLQFAQALVAFQTVRCSVLQYVAVCCSVFQCVAVRCSALQCVAVCCSVLQCVAVCCSV